MYNEEIISKNESTNDGDRIYTYCNDMVGAMEAFGYSAFLASRLIGEVLCMWDEKISMPCAVLRKDEMLTLGNLGVIEEVSTQSMVQVILSEALPYDKNDYERWMNVLKQRKSKIEFSSYINDATDEKEGQDTATSAKKVSPLPFLGASIKKEYAITLFIASITILVIIALCIGGGDF